MYTVMSHHTSFPDVFSETCKYFNLIHTICSTYIYMYMYMYMYKYNYTSQHIMGR